MRTQTIIILSWLWILATGSYAGATSFSVTVINKTTGKALGDYPVTVLTQTVERSGDNRQKISDRTDGNGVFGKKTAELLGKVLTAEVNYRGISYSSEPVTIEDGNKNYKLSVDVYEITSTRENVHITSRRMLLLPRDDKTLEIDDLLQVENSGAKTYVGAFNDALDLNEVLHIPMPKDYVLIGYQTDDAPKINQTGRAIISHDELPPGKRTISMRYVVRSDTGHFDLTLQSGGNAPKIERLALYVPVGSPLTIGAGSLKKIESKTLGGTSYSVLQGRPGSVLRLSAYSPSYKGGFGIRQISIIAAFLLACPMLLLFRRRMQKRHLRQEHATLIRLQKAFAEETKREELMEYYRPLLQVVSKRAQVLSRTEEG